MNARERKLGGILLVCVGALLIAFFAMVILPKYQEMSKKADEATKAKNEAELKLKQAKELKKNEKNINERSSNLKARIPSSLELQNVIYRLDERAVANNLTWLQGTPEDPTTLAEGGADVQAGTIAPQLKRHDFSIVVEGTVADLTRFMSSLTDKSIGRIIVITSLDVEFKSDIGPEAIGATLKLQVIGWEEGADISPDGCSTDSASDDAATDPSCNRNTVTTKAKQGSS